MSGETPSGLPSLPLPVTRRKFERLMAARSVPVGASAATAAGEGVGSGMAPIVARRRGGGVSGDREESAAMTWQAEIDELHHRQGLAHQMGGEERVARQRAAGKL